MKGRARLLSAASCLTPHESCKSFNVQSRAAGRVTLSHVQGRRSAGQAYSPLHKALFQQPGSRKPADIKLIISQVLNEAPTIVSMPQRVKEQIASSALATVRLGLSTMHKHVVREAFSSVSWPQHSRPCWPSVAEVRSVAAGVFKDHFVSTLSLIHI